MDKLLEITQYVEKRLEINKKEYEEFRKDLTLNEEHSLISESIGRISELERIKNLILSMEG